MDYGFSHILKLEDEYFSKEGRMRRAINGTLVSIRMNHSFHGGKCLPARLENSKLQNTNYVSIACISITIKFINEVVNDGAAYYHYPFL